MKKRHLFWIIPLTMVISFIGAYICSFNAVVDIFNQKLEVIDAVNQMEEDLADSLLITVGNYEYYCPDIAKKLESGEIQYLMEHQLEELDILPKERYIMD